MPLVAPLISAAVAIGAIAGAAVTTQNWSQQRSTALYAEIDADIRQTLRRHDLKKEEVAARELRMPQVIGAAAANTATVGHADAKTDSQEAAKTDTKARKAQIGSLRKRAMGTRRERLVPPDFARMPISVMRSVLGFAR